MSDRYSYRNLILWQQAQELAHDIIQITKRMTPSWASAIIARQIISAATSIGANIAEGHGRFSVAAHRNHLSIARGFAAETDSWLDLMRREGILNEDEESQLHIRCRKLIGMLTTKINMLSDQTKGDAGSIHESTESYEHETETVWPFTVDDYLDSTMSLIRLVPLFSCSLVHLQQELKLWSLTYLPNTYASSILPCAMANRRRASP